MENITKLLRTSFELFTDFVNWCFTGSAKNFLIFTCLSMGGGILFPLGIIVASAILLLGGCIILATIVEKHDRMGLVPMYAFCFFFAIFTFLGAEIKKYHLIDQPIITLSSA